MSTKTTAKKAPPKTPVAKKVTPTPTSAAKNKKAVVKVFEGEVKVKKVKPTVTTENIITAAHSQVTKLFS